MIVYHQLLEQILAYLKVYKACLHRIFETPLKLLRISFGNPKLFKLDLKLVRKEKTDIGKSDLMPVSKYRLFCVVSSANVKKNYTLRMFA